MEKNKVIVKRNDKGIVDSGSPVGKKLIYLLLSTILIALYEQIVNFAKIMFTSRMNFSEMNWGYDAFNFYLYESGLLKRNRNKDMSIGYGKNNSFKEYLGMGYHIMKINGKWCFLERSKSEFQEWSNITLIYLGHDKEWERDLNERIMLIKASEGSINKRKDLLDINVSDGEGNFHDCDKIITRKRSLDSIYIPKEQKNELTSAIDNFLSSEQWYLERSIPYRLGILLHSKPGLGKSSLIKALASHYNRNIYYVKMKDINSIEKCFAKIPKGSFVVLEDIDANSLTHSRKKTQESKVEISVESSGKDKFGKPSGKNEGKLTLSELLNCLDGLTATEDRVLFFTTNHIEKLDDALIRPGRVDLQMEIKYPDEECFRDFVKVFYKKTIKHDFKLKSSTYTIAKIQSEINLKKLSYEECLTRFTTKITKKV